MRLKRSKYGTIEECRGSIVGTVSRGSGCRIGALWCPGGPARPRFKALRNSSAAPKEHILTAANSAAAQHQHMLLSVIRAASVQNQNG